MNNNFNICDECVDTQTTESIKWDMHKAGLVIPASVLSTHKGQRLLKD